MTETNLNAFHIGSWTAGRRSPKDLQGVCGTKFRQTVLRSMFQFQSFPYPLSPTSLCFFMFFLDRTVEKYLGFCCWLKGRGQPGSILPSLGTILRETAQNCSKPAQKLLKSVQFPNLFPQKLNKKSTNLYK